MRVITITFCLLLWFSVSNAQERPRNLILITLDGFRWQELFQGADSSLLFHTGTPNDREFRDAFWAREPAVRRKKLMPFMWGTIALQGQLYGNRLLNNKMNCANALAFSYPGYSEMLVGFVDRRVHSNKKFENPNATVLEFINADSAYHQKVAVFSTWDVVPYAAGAFRNTLHYNSGNDTNIANEGEHERMLNDLEKMFTNPFGHRLDIFTFYKAFMFLKRQRPHVLFMSFDETDEHSHGGRYDEYLRSAHRTDQMIAELWTWLQSDEQYRDNTTLVITTDHGRGKLFRSSWKNHGLSQPGSGEIWMAVMGPDTPALGEMTAKRTYYQKQIARTLAAAVGLDYNNVRVVGDKIETVLYKPVVTLK